MRATPLLRGALRATAPALALATAGLAVACADGPTAPAAPAAAAFGKSGPGSTTSGTSGSSISVAAWLDGTAATKFGAIESGVQTQYTAGDTVVTLIQVGTNASKPATFDLGLSGKLNFHYAATSICDPAKSGYGAGTWNLPCAASAKPVRIAAKTWIDSTGKVATDFQPALRFVPGDAKGVVLTLKDAALAGTRVDYCTATGCVDEAATDASVAARLDQANGFVTRLVKHFSGYIVVASRKGPTAPIAPATGG